MEDATKYHQYEVIGDFNKIEIYFNNTLDVGLKDKITTYMAASDLSCEKLKIQKGGIANGFGSQGGGIQYELPLPVNLLKDLGLLKGVNINVKK